jgi:hypothetical protein
MVLRSLLSSLLLAVLSQAPSVTVLLGELAKGYVFVVVPASAQAAVLTVAGSL